MFTLGTHATNALPDWIRYEGGYVFVKGNTFALRISTDVENARFFDLFAPADGHKRADLDNPASCEVIEVPVKGQKTRIKSLFAAIEACDFGSVKRIVASLTKYHAKLFTVEVWSYEEDRTVPRAFRKHGHGHTFALTGTLNAQRRHCYAAGIDHVLVKIAGGTEVEVTEALDALESEDGDDHIGGHPIREDEGMARAFNKVLAHYTERGYVPAGGSPDAGLLLFVNPETVTGVETAESLQRAGKIMLRGGVQLRGGPEDTITAELVDFESGEYGHRDGIFMAIDNRVMAPIARKSGVEAAWSYQGHYIEEGVSFMKGMVYVVGRNCPTRHLRKLLGSSEMPAVVDINIYNKVVDTGAQVGDIVEIDPNNLWVMEADVSNPAKTVRLSAQLLERAGELLAQWLDDKMTRGIASFVHDVSTGEFADHVSPFTRIGKLSNLGLPAFEADKEKIEEELAKTAALYARKGVRVKGADARLFHDDDLSVDVTSDGQQIPGARVPKQWGLNVGDRFVFVAYPALNALDSEGRNTCIFVCEVEEVHASTHIYLHGDVAVTALRDEDGDKPIVLLPEKEDDELPAVGQAKLRLTTRLSKEEASNDAAAAEKQRAFGADVSDKYDLLTRAKRLFQVYMRLGSQVGTVDNRVSSIQLYLGDRIHSVDTPTGEHATEYMAKCNQNPIEGMKHPVDGRYTLHKLNAWTKEILPEAWVEEDGREKFVHHPGLEVRKPASGETTIMQHLKALEVMRAAVQNKTVTSVGRWAEQVNYLFATLPYHKVEMESGDDAIVPTVDGSLLMTDERFNAALGVLHSTAAGMFEDSEVFYACAGVAEEVYTDSINAGRRAAGTTDDEDKGLVFWAAQTKTLSIAGTRLRFDLLPAERLAVDVLWLHTAPKSATGAKLAKVALHAGSREIIQMLGRVITEELTAADVKAELGLDGRNRITGSVSNKLDQYVRAGKHAAARAGIHVELEDTDGIAEGDVVTAGAPGIKQVRLITLANGERRWFADNAVGKIKVLNTTEYTVMGVDHDTNIVELS